MGCLLKACSVGQCHLILSGGRNHSCSSLQDGWEREKTRPGEKLGDCCCRPVQRGGGSDYWGGIGDGEK